MARFKANWNTISFRMSVIISKLVYYQRPWLLMNMYRAIFLFCIITILCSATLAQEKEPCNGPKAAPLQRLAPKTNLPFMKGKEYLEKRDNLESYFCSLYDSKEKEHILSQSKETIIKTLTSDKDFWKLAKARYWAVKNAETIPDLIELIKNPAFVGLKGQADLIIMERIESGDLEFYGHGWVVPDDLFRVAGRASWILNESTGQRFGKVTPTSTAAELKQLADAWAKWYKKQKQI